MICLNCNKNKAQKVSPYGYIYCKQCIKKQSKYKVAATIELTTGEIKESRKKYSDDILQRKRGDTASLEYIKKYGTKGFTKEELREARNVWTETSPYVDKHEKYITKKE